MPFTVPPLPYAFDALEPYIDKQTMEIHHDKHHGAYVTNLNKALDGHADLQAKSLEDLLKNLDSIPENIRATVRNNAGGHWNHSLFWTQMKKGGGGEPGGDFERGEEHFGSPELGVAPGLCDCVGDFGHRDHEHYDGDGHRADPGDRDPNGRRGLAKGDSAPVSDGGGPHARPRCAYWETIRNPTRS